VFAVFSGYFNFDLPSITSKQLKSPPLDLSNTQLGLLFSVYAIPNTFLPLISGAFLQWAGVWNGVLSIAALKTSGVLLVNVGIAVSQYPVILLGRVLYGLGGESLYVGIDVLTTTWFLGSELGFSYGLVEVRAGGLREVWGEIANTGTGKSGFSFDRGPVKAAHSPRFSWSRRCTTP
jgi:MFS family permease